jgi:chromosome segregation ATPase
MRSIAEQSKMMDARIRSKHEEMSVLMRDLEKKREEINKDVALLDQALGEVSGMESGLDLLSQTVESVLQLNLSSTRQIKTLIDRLEVLSKDPVVDKRQMAVIIGSIKSILQSQDADETVVEGIRKQIENIKSDFEGLDAIGLRLSEKQDSYNELVEKMTSIKSEIEALYAEGTSTNLQERLEEVTEQFAVLKLLSEEQARHIADSMAGVQNARSSLEQAGAKAEESGQKMDAIKKKAGLATFRDLVLQVGITAAATGAGVMTGGLAYPLLIAAAGHGTMQYKSQITSVPGYVKSGIGSVGSVIGLW